MVRGCHIGGGQDRRPTATVPAANLISVSQPGECKIVRRKPKIAPPAFDRPVLEFQEWLRLHRGNDHRSAGSHDHATARRSAAAPRAGTPSRRFAIAGTRLADDAACYSLIVADFHRFSLPVQSVHSLAPSGADVPPHPRSFDERLCDAAADKGSVGPVPQTLAAGVKHIPQLGSWGIVGVLPP